MWPAEATDTSKPGAWLCLVLAFIIICGAALYFGGRND